MMSSDIVQHVDIEVMKAEMATIREAIQNVGAKMDVVLQMQITLTQLQERTEHSRLALDRAFTSIREIKSSVELVSSEQSRAMGFVKGGAAIGVILFAFAQYYMGQQINSLKEVTDAFVAMDRRLVFIETKLWPDLPAGGNKNGR